ncbi:Uncharacterised protein [Sebaldella termitidis]|uniref:Lipoprotein n=1 Tax=Sebaldella termitidis (strain ATCC 33386 / NCTC 11300) TaxID=526218 RepID=D1AM31_SEBTE|nr:hypothetical protein Sterm_2555 [Sebaldella termitidis ATCC 33386]SUI24727.1 Uncharacterised protein [Sebaldella termitidis]
MKKVRLFILVMICMSALGSCGSRKCSTNGINVCGPAVNR